MKADHQTQKPVLVYHHRTQAVDAQGIHIYEICRAFRNLGWHVEMVSLVKEEAVGKESREGGIYTLLDKIPDIVYEFMEILYNVAGIWRLWKTVRKIKPRLIYERYSIYNFAGAAVSRLTGVPLVEEINAPLALEKREYGTLYFPRLAQKTETWIVNQSFRTITVTRVLKDILAAEGAQAEKIVVMPNGVNLEEFDGERAGISVDDSLTIGFVGWFRSWHGLQNVIEVMGRENWAEQGVNLLLIGDGPARKDIEQAVQDAGLNGSVRITGAVDRKTVRKLLSEIDIALQPAATSYASPMKLIEYMASGKAIVAPAQANIQELLHHEENALLFQPGDWQDFVRQVERLIHDKTLTQTLGHSARIMVLQRPLAWEYNARRVADWFDGEADFPIDR